MRLRWRVLSRMSWLMLFCLFGLAGLAGLVGCRTDDSSTADVRRSINTIRPVRDARTGLCFIYTDERSGTRFGLSSVSCEWVEPVLARSYEVGREVTDRLLYIRLSGERADLCFAFVEDDAGNQRSNLASVPCEVIIQAHDQGGLPVQQYWP
ncbi:MAG: hypothetical protein V1738_01870 [Patescibacteria group bacterium]